MITSENIKLIIKELTKRPYKYLVTIAKLPNGDTIIEFTSGKDNEFQLIYNKKSVNITYFYQRVSLGTIKLSIAVTEDIEEDINNLFEVCDSITENSFHKFIETECKD